MKGISEVNKILINARYGALCSPNRYDEFRRWYRQHLRDYLALRVHAMRCECCGDPADTFDHILAVGRRIPRSIIEETFKDFMRGNLQRLCRKCNVSKAQGSVCHIHKNYLGLWNFLPKLDDLENWKGEDW